MKGDVVTVLDIGSTKVAALAATRVKGKLQVEAVEIADCKGLKKGVVVDLDETARAISEATRKLQDTLGQEVGSFVVGFGGSHVDGVNAQGYIPIYPRTRTITREDVMQVIKHSRQHALPADRDQIQAIPREFKIDGQGGIQRPIGMNGSKLEVSTYLVIAESTHVANLEKAVRVAGKKVDQMVLQPLATGLAVLAPEETSLGALVVDIGGGTTDLALFTGGSISYTASLPIGGQMVTSDLSKLLKTSPEEAERLKIADGTASVAGIADADSVDVLQLGQTHARPLQRRVLCEIIQSRMRELAKMVKRELDKSGSAGSLSGGVVLAGGGSMLRGSAALFEEVLEHHRVRLAEVVLSGHKELSGHSVATAIGLAEYALGSAENELSPSGSGNDGWRDRVRTLWSLLGRS